MAPPLFVPQAVKAALAEAGVRFAYLFGSRAAGTATEDSDADVAVMPGRELGLHDLGGLVRSLEAGFDLPKVDLVLLDHASLELRGHVVRDGRLIYSVDEPGRVDFEVRTQSEYLDFLPTLKELERSYLERVARHGL